MTTPHTGSWLPVSVRCCSRPGVRVGYAVCCPHRIGDRGGAGHHAMGPPATARLGQPDPLRTRNRYAYSRPTGADRRFWQRASVYQRFDQIPQQMKDALLAVEDARFTSTKRHRPHQRGTRRRLDCQLWPGAPCAGRVDHHAAGGTHLPAHARAHLTRKKLKGGHPVAASRPRSPRPDSGAST